MRNSCFQSQPEPLSLTTKKKVYSTFCNSTLMVDTKKVIVQCRRAAVNRQGQENRESLDYPKKDKYRSSLSSSCATMQLKTG
jgi:hypothetical protein